MVTKAAVIRQAILLSAAISVFPLILYPATFGIPAFSLHPLYIFAEWGLYFLIYLLSRTKLRLTRLLMAGGITVLFRVGIGLVLATLIWLMRDVPLEKTIPQSLWEYPPAYGLHIVFAPFVLLPLLNRVWIRGIRFSIDTRRFRSATAVGTGFSFSGQSAAQSSPRPAAESDDLSFDAACGWIGDYSGIRMSIIADEDGLVVAQWSRQSYSQDAEFWAAVAIEMVRFHRQWPPSPEQVDLRKLEVETNSGKLLARRAGPFWLIVQMEPDAGELVQVRVAQAKEMIEKFYQDRYRSVQSAGVEVSHV